MPEWLILLCCYWFVPSSHLSLDTERFDRRLYRFRQFLYGDYRDGTSK
jgi:hypothetical protein